MTRLRFMIWIIVPVALYVAYATFGLPHIRWSYTWLDEGQGFEPLAQRYYTRCSFLGPFGQFDIHHPAQGTCAWIIFRKAPASTRG